MKFEKIDITKENINPFQRIGQDWMLISAEREGKVNTMTASWGMMGVFWGKNVVTVGIRPQRFTKEFVDAGEFFTLTFFDGERKEEMGYLGKVSGRDEDKFEKADIKWENATYVDAPILTDCPVSIECSVVDSTMPGTHELFIGKVEAIHVDEEYLDANGNILWNKIDLM